MRRSSDRSGTLDLNFDRLVNCSVKEWLEEGFMWLSIRNKIGLIHYEICDNLEGQLNQEYVSHLGPFFFHPSFNRWSEEENIFLEKVPFPFLCFQHQISSPNKCYIIAIFNWVYREIWDNLFCLTLIFDWSRKLVPSSQVIRCKTVKQSWLGRSRFPAHKAVWSV